MRDGRYSTSPLPAEYRLFPEQEQRGMGKAILVPPSAGKLLSELRAKGGPKEFAKKAPYLVHLGDAPPVIGLLRYLLNVPRCGGLSPFLRRAKEGW